MIDVLRSGGVHVKRDAKAGHPTHTFGQDHDADIATCSENFASSIATCHRLTFACLFRKVIVISSYGPSLNCN